MHINKEDSKLLLIEGWAEKKLTYNNVNKVRGLLMANLTELLALLPTVETTPTTIDEGFKLLHDGIKLLQAENIMLLANQELMKGYFRPWVEETEEEQASYDNLFKEI